MKQLLFVSLLLANTIKGHCQQNEFTVYSNGLIYSDTAMARLKHIVDSLNLKYRHCDLYKTYYSVEQGLGHYITVKKGDALPACNAMLNNISLADFMRQYPLAHIDSNLLLTEVHDTNYNGQTIDEYEVILHNGRTEHSTAPGPGRMPVEKTNDMIWGRKGRWVIEYTTGVYDSSKDLQAIFIVQEPFARPIPDSYAKLILYSDCMIDTTSDIFFKTATGGYMDFEYDKEKRPAPIRQFMDYVDSKSKHVLMKYQQDTAGDYIWRYNDSVTQKFIRDSLSGTAVFKQLLSDAVQKTLQLGLPTDDLFEYYTEAYYSGSAALAMKRNRRVYGACSRDESPRFYVMSIALLAAETANWEVFLRAHLDIMNDRLDRMANSSFAQEKRKTYIKEIEELGINIQDLMLGISFQISNPSGYHYFGDVGRVGRAFSETKDSSSLELKLLSAVRDSQLDDYNRLTMHFLFLNYTYYLPRKEHRMACLEKLESADKSLPHYLQPLLTIYKEAYEKGPDERKY